MIQQGQLEKKIHEFEGLSVRTFPFCPACPVSQDERKLISCLNAMKNNNDDFYSDDHMRKHLS